MTIADFPNTDSPFATGELWVETSGSLKKCTGGAASDSLTGTTLVGTLGLQSCEHRFKSRANIVSMSSSHLSELLPLQQASGLGGWSNKMTSCSRSLKKFKLIKSH